MRRRQIRVPSGVLFVWFTLAGLILLFSPRTLTDRLQFTFARALYLPLNLFRTAAFTRLDRPLPEDAVSRTKYNKLRNHLANVTEWLETERQKVERLSALNDRPAWKGVSFVLADVITSPGNYKLTINRGRNDGLTEGQFVLGNKAVIGTISALDARTAQIKLITDPKSRIVVKMAKSDVERVMQGTGNNFAKILLLPTKHEVKTGDIVCAQKRPGFLSTPMIVGTIAQCVEDQEDPLLWDITVQPACDIRQLKEVEVVVMNPQRVARGS